MVEFFFVINLVLGSNVDSCVINKCLDFLLIYDI